MKSIRELFVLGAVAALSGCGAQGETPSDSTETSATSAQAITLADCQKQVASCTLSAKTFFDLGKCTTQFQSCTTQAALDLTNQTNLLSNCRTKTNACLTGAVTLTDISACRSVYDVCAADITATTSDALKSAIDAAKAAVDKATDVTISLIQDASTTATSALDAATTCETQATKCLDAALNLSGVQTCQDAFDQCTQKAVSLVDTALDPLPGPTPSQLVSGYTDCQNKTQDCLAKAITSLDALACQVALQSCVSTSTNLIEQTFTDLTQIIDPLLGIQPVDCSKQAADCLLKLNNPLDCAAQAATCLTH